ncbi:Os08g0347000, partial [Oryza sativa Japonica Group]
NCHSSKAILLAKSFPLFFNQSIEFFFSQGDPSCKRNKMPAQATGSSKRVPSVGGGKEREVLKIDSETKSNQPPTKKASSKPAPKKNDKVQGGGKGKK